MHFDIDDRVSLRGFRPEDRQDLVNGLNEWAVTRWLGRVPHPYRLDHADAFLARDEHLHVNEAVRDGSRSLSLALCHCDRVIGGFVRIRRTRLVSVNWASGWPGRIGGRGSCDVPRAT